MRVFRGIRENPPQDYIDKGLTNGPSNPDYEGCVFDDGTTIIRWLTLKHSTSIFSDYQMFLDIHGHPEYGTTIHESTYDILD
jgi:hypothetical protein